MNKEPEQPKDSSLDSKYRYENPDLAKEQDKLPKGHDLHGAGATVDNRGVNPLDPPDVRARRKAAEDANEATKADTKKAFENKDSAKDAKDAPKTTEQVEVTDEGAKKPKRD